MLALRIGKAYGSPHAKHLLCSWSAVAEVPALARLVALFLVRRLAIWCEVKIINSYGLRNVSVIIGWV